jgi:hypothetical protein
MCQPGDPRATGGDTTDLALHDSTVLVVDWFRLPPQDQRMHAVLGVPVLERGLLTLSAASHAFHAGRFVNPQDIIPTPLSLVPALTTATRGGANYSTTRLMVLQRDPNLRELADMTRTWRTR